MIRGRLVWLDSRSVALLSLSDTHDPACFDCRKSFGQTQLHL